MLHFTASSMTKALAAVWDGVPVQRCAVHKLRNLLAHAPEGPSSEIGLRYRSLNASRYMASITLENASVENRLSKVPRAVHAIFFAGKCL